MEIRQASFDQDAKYIRHIRAETLKSLGLTPTPELIEPAPVANYLVGYRGLRSVGLAESALLGDVYGSYDDSPNDAICNLDEYCPIEEMATIRTVYVAPEFRGSSSLYAALTCASVKLLFELGAKYATATTSVYAHRLHQLYLKCGGEVAGEGCVGGIEMTLFVFDLQQATSHHVMRRVSPFFAFDIPQECSELVAN